jgi:hypothetical protein
MRWLKAGEHIGHNVTAGEFLDCLNLALHAPAYYLYAT